MKHRIINILGILALAAACQRAPEQPAPSVNFPGGDTPSVNFSSDGGESKVSFSTTRGWTASVNGEDSGWLTVKPAEGPAGDGVITISADRNMTAENRTASVRLSCEAIYRDIKVSQREGRATTLREIADKASSTSQSFTELLSSVVVTYVNDSYAFAEDKSGGLLIYLPDHGLKAGSTIDGQVNFTLSLYSGLPEITAIDLSKATLGETTVIPITTVTAKDIKDNIKKYLSMRVKLEDVYVKDGIKGKSASGTINQGGTELTIFSKTSDVDIPSGKTGTLVTFPSIYGASYELLVFTSSQFTASDDPEPDPSGENGFTRTVQTGIYNISDINAPVSIYQPSEFAQTSYGKSSNSRWFSALEFDSNTMLNITAGATTFTPGSSYSIKVLSFGADTCPSGSYTMKCAAVTTSKVWLQDDASKRGFIIPLK